MSIDINDFKRELECICKDEKYLVRDNGAVLRHSRDGKRMRKDDDQWSFGKPNEKTGYMNIGSERVHRIVAFAFHGEPLTTQHVVDHIDTNRRNNRPENLRWLTKLENVLNNPITRKKIEYYCGSIENFIKDPSILQDYVTEDPNFEWMRAVTTEEAQISYELQISWVENSKSTTKGGSLGEWIYRKNNNPMPFQKDLSDFIASKTPNAVQEDWRTPCEFPCCPQGTHIEPITVYVKNLEKGNIFAQNEYSHSTILDFAISEDKNMLWVLCKFSPEGAIKPWSLAQVTYNNNLFIHTSLGSFFKEIGAEKQFTIAQGIEWTGEDSFDDYC